MQEFDKKEFNEHFYFSLKLRLQRQPLCVSSTIITSPIIILNENKLNNPFLLHCCRPLGIASLFTFRAVRSSAANIWNVPRAWFDA